MNRAKIVNLYSASLRVLRILDSWGPSSQLVSQGDWDLWDVYTLRARMTNAGVPSDVEDALDQLEVVTAYEVVGVASAANYFQFRSHSAEVSFLRWITNSPERLMYARSHVGTGFPTNTDYVETSLHGHLPWFRGVVRGMAAAGVLRVRHGYYVPARGPFFLPRTRDALRKFDLGVRATLGRNIDSVIRDAYTADFLLEPDECTPPPPRSGLFCLDINQLRFGVLCSILHYGTRLHE